MKIFNICNTTTINFKGIREDRNTISQLTENNDYSLNEPNQQRINSAIDRLSQESGEDNINFLLNVGKNLKYQTNITNGTECKNDWRTKLQKAAEESLKHSDVRLIDEYHSKILSTFSLKPLNPEEKYIVNKKNSIIEKIDDEKLKEKTGRNLDYFITSSETSTAQKAYIMERLDYFMSPEYEINPQLKDKKSEILSEMVNDIVINTPESKIPNIKEINQKQHGMCAAISIVRKAIAYEDKPNYVDSILSELSAEDTMEVYDIQNLGSGKKIPIKKIYIDFDYAQKKGYRIVDASALQWMNAATINSSYNERLKDYNAFDKNNYDAFQDTFFLKNIDDPYLRQKQSYYQSLVKAKDDIGRIKARKIKKEEIREKNHQRKNQNIDELQELNKKIRTEIKEILPNLSREEINKAVSDVYNLQKPQSKDIKKNEERLRKYSYIPNEERSQKEKKIVEYFNNNYGDETNQKVLIENSKKLVDDIDRTKEIEEEVISKNSLNSQIINAQRLYQAESIYRATKLLGLQLEEKNIPALIKYNIPDMETRILLGFDKVIEKIDKENDEKLLNDFAKKFNTTPDNKEEILKNLREKKQSIYHLTTSGFDRLYNRLGYMDRQDFILQDIKESKEQIKCGNTEELECSAICMGLKPEKNIILKEYDKIEKELMENPCDEKTYIKSINKLGCKDQSKMIVDAYRTFTEIIQSDNPERENFINDFEAANGLNQNASEEEIIATINEIGNEYNQIADAINSSIDLLNVQNEDGSPYFTVSSSEILIKKMENEGILIPEKTMKKLQERFAEIDKIDESTEFKTEKNDIKKSELCKLSKEEKIAIKDIDKKINSMYAEVSRNLNKEYRDMKEPLEKLANYIGTNSGDYWLSKEGLSGLSSSQEVKIFESITDKPYYTETNIENAVNKIKEGTNSGVSTTSVFHDRSGGWHTQYVANIEKEKNGGVTLFHDNSWGKHEHKNNWTDSEGRQRTDYQDNRGGENGYIVDENWRNGNDLQELTNKYGHIDADSTENKIYKRIKTAGREESDFPMIVDIIVPGESPEYHDITASIKDTLFVTDLKYIKDLEKYSKNHTKEEIKKALFRIKNAGNGYKEKYEEIKTRIEPTNFNKGITTKSEYDNLPEDDIVKITFEKAAVRNAYDSYEITKKLTKANTLKDIQKVKAKQRQIAMRDFEYSFSKHEDALLYAGTEHNQEFVNILKTSLKNQNIKIKSDVFTAVLKNIVSFTPQERKLVNGSLRNTINLSLKKAIKQFDENIPYSENSQKAKAEYIENLNNLLEKYSYINDEDMKDNSEHFKHVKKWIDRKFEPKTDEEFIEIYKKLQDMTKPEFDELTKDIKDSELGIKEITGFDILNKVNVKNEEYENLLENTLFFDIYMKDVEKSNTLPTYKYKKTERKSDGAIYVGGKRSFDDIYRTMYFSLKGLTYKKEFDKYKEQYYKKYGFLPAYPKVDIGKTENLTSIIDDLLKEIDDSIFLISSQKICLQNIALVNKLEAYRKQIPNDKTLTKEELEIIQSMICDFIDYNCQDPDMEKPLNSAANILSIEKDAKISDIKEDLDTICDNIHEFEKTNSEEALRTSIKNGSLYLNKTYDLLIKTNIPPKYHKIIHEDITNLSKLMINDEKEKSGEKDYKDLIELQEKIADASVSANDKTQTEMFVKLMSQVQNIKNIRKTYKIKSETLSRQIDSINNYADMYVDKFIEEDKKQKIRAQINDWINKELYGTKPETEKTTEIIKATAKLKEDFVKYHLLNNPIELLDNMLLLSAKDAKENKELGAYKRYLEEALELTKFIELQETMMNAIQTGNPSQVRKHFDDYNVWIDNTPINMGSDDAMRYILNSLIVTNSSKTAKMFVEKFGLGDQIMRIEKNDLKNSKIKEKIDEMTKLISINGKIEKIINQEYETFLENINDADNIDIEICKAKKTIADKTKEYTKDNKNAAKMVKDYLQAFDKGKRLILKNPTLPRNILMQQPLDDASNKNAQEINKEMQEHNRYIQDIAELYQFLLNLHLPEYSKGYEIQKELKKDFVEIANYNNIAINSAVQEIDNVSLIQKAVIS